MKYILILILILSCELHATTMEDQNKWHIMKSSPLEERPYALHSMLNWVEPTIIDLPPSSFSIRKELIEGLVYHYNTYTKNHVDLKLMIAYTLISNQRNEMFDIHKYITDDLKVFLQDFINGKRNNYPTLNNSLFIIESNGKYRFVDIC